MAPHDHVEICVIGVSLIRCLRKGFIRHSVSARVNIIIILFITIKLFTISADQVLANKRDQENLFKNVRVLIERVLVKRIPAFSRFEPSVTKHIDHPYSNEMAGATYWVCACRCRCDVDVDV